jgi:hypothetical protein
VARMREDDANAVERGGYRQWRGVHILSRPLWARTVSRDRITDFVRKVRPSWLAPP